MTTALLPYDPGGSSALDRWDPRLRLAATLILALATLALRQPLSLLIALAGVLLLAIGAGIAPRTLLLRLLPLELFMLLLLLTLPFTLQHGEVWFRLGPLSAYRGGLERALVVALKANLVVVAVFALLGTMSTATLEEALLRLRVPEKLVQLLQFTLRYLGVLHEEYLRLRRAMRARAFAPGSDRHTLRTFGWLVGMLLVRSLERSERVLAAMKCRGFDGRLPAPAGRVAWQTADTARLVILVCAMLALLSVDRF